ncbi:MAG: alpha/beta fold hydrolase [Synechococcales bacterium]|nr:alpha/beta fold hydrolase [Synechococcales bacterium]
MTASTPSLAAPTYEKSTWHWRGHSICYATLGEGPPLVLIHGFGASIDHWRKNIPVLAASGYRVYALDLLGFGGSDKPVQDYALESWVELLRDFWEAHIQEPAVWIGNSIGALMALMVMAEHPAIARAGVLLNAAGGLNHRPEELNLPLRLFMGAFSRAISTPVIGQFLFDRIRQKSRLRSTLKQVYCDRDAITDDLVDIIYQPTCDPNAPKVFAAIITAPSGPSPADLLPQIHQPLLVLWGEADPWTPISGAKIYQTLAQQEPERVQFYPIPQTGHCPHDEHPDQVNPKILDWLSTILR